MRRSALCCLLLGLTIWLASPVSAELERASEYGFVSTHELLLAAPPQRAWRALTRDLPRWWNADHSYSGDARRFRLDARAGGCFCERLASGSVEHLRVVFADAPRELRLSGGLGPLQTMAVNGSMVFQLEAAGEGTRLRYRYAVSGDPAAGLGELAAPVDRVQLDQLERLAAYLAAE